MQNKFAIQKERNKIGNLLSTDQSDQRSYLRGIKTRAKCPQQGLAKPHIEKIQKS